MGQRATTQKKVRSRTAKQRTMPNQQNIKSGAHVQPFVMVTEHSSTAEVGGEIDRLYKGMLEIVAERQKVVKHVSEQKCALLDSAQRISCARKALAPGKSCNELNEQVVALRQTLQQYSAHMHDLKHTMDREGVLLAGCGETLVTLTALLEPGMRKNRRRR